MHNNLKPRYICQLAVQETQAAEINEQTLNDDGAFMKYIMLSNIHWCTLVWNVIAICALCPSGLKKLTDECGMKVETLTCDWQLSSPPDHKVPKLQLARVIPNVVFSHFLDGQSVPPPLYGLSPLLWLAFLDLNKQRDTKHAAANVKKGESPMKVINYLSRDKRARFNLNITQLKQSQSWDLLQDSLASV